MCIRDRSTSTILPATTPACIRALARATTTPCSSWAPTSRTGPVSYTHLNGLARSLNTIAIRVGDLVGASNIFNFVYNTLQLTTLDPANDVGLAQMVMGSQTHGVTPTALAAAFQIFYDGEYTLSLIHISLCQGRPY